MWGFSNDAAGQQSGAKLAGQSPAVGSGQFYNVELHRRIPAHKMETKSSSGQQS
jgi:hypothetical protein